MYSLILSTVLATATFAAVLALARPYPYGWLIALLAGLAAGLASHVAAVYVVNRRLRAIMPEVEQALMGQRPDQAIRLLEGARRLAKWQLLIDKALDGQIGVILFAYKQDRAEALPYLERTFANNWQAKAMLGVHHFDQRDDAAMKTCFEDTLKQVRKEGMLWSIYAWCVWKRGDTPRAVAILERARKELPDDEPIARNLQALQTGKKMKMNAYEPEWFLYGLQRPPAQVVGGGRRMGGHPMGMRQVGGRAMGGRRARGR